MMKTANKISLLMLASMIVALLLACGGDDNDDRDTATTPSLTAANLTEDGYFDGMLYYQITSNSPNEVSIAKAAKAAVKIEIPAQINIEGKTYKCTSITKKAFDDCKGLLSIKIGKNVVSINISAFYNCTALEEISVDKGNTSFDSRDNCNAIVDTRHNSIIVGCKSTTFPKDVFTIGSYAFYKRSGLVKLDLPANIYFIDKMAFYDCDDLVDVSIMASCVGEYAFSDCSKMKSINLGPYMMLIGENAFYRCDVLRTVRCLRTRGIPDYGYNISFNEGERPTENTYISMISFSDENFSCYITYEHKRSFDVFDSETYWYGTLYVSKGMAEEYQKENGWGQFGKIEEEG